MNSYLKRLKDNMHRDPEGSFNLLDDFTCMFRNAHLAVDHWYDEVSSDRNGRIPNAKNVVRRINQVSDLVDKSCALLPGYLAKHHVL